VTPVSNALCLKPTLLAESFCLLGREAGYVFLVGSPKLTSNKRCYCENDDKYANEPTIGFS